MSIPSQGVIGSIGLQPGKVGIGGTFDSSAIDYYKMRIAQISYGPLQDMRPFPPETGGPITNDGTYKRMAAFGGQFDVLPRLENSFGVLLLAAMGSVSSVANVDGDGDAVTGLYTHMFKFASSQFYQPWVSARKFVPGVTNVHDMGEVGIDLKVGSLRFTVPGAGKVAARIALQGREWVHDDGTGWTYQNAAFEDPATVPDAGVGHFYIGGVEYPIMGATFNIASGLTDPESEMIHGSMHPDDVVRISANCSIQAVYKFENPMLYRQIMDGSITGTSFAQLPFFTETAGNVWGFEAVYYSPDPVTGSSPSSNHAIRFRANKVAWTVDGILEAQAGSIITLALTGIVETPASGDYFQIVIENGISGYTIPSAIEFNAPATLGYTGSPARADLAPSATVTRYGGNLWNGGFLKATFGTPTVGTLDSNDTLDIENVGTSTGQVGVSGSNVSYEGTVIGTVSGGTTAAPLIVRWNANATTAAVQAVLQALRYGRTGGAQALDSFPVVIQLADKFGQTASDTVVVTHS